MHCYPAYDAATTMALYGTSLFEARVFEYCDKAAESEGLTVAEVYLEVHDHVVDVPAGLIAPDRRPFDRQDRLSMFMRHLPAYRAGALNPWLVTVLESLPWWSWDSTAIEL